RGHSGASPRTNASRMPACSVASYCARSAIVYGEGWPRCAILLLSRAIRHRPERARCRLDFSTGSGIALNRGLESRQFESHVHRHHRSPNGAPCKRGKGRTAMHLVRTPHQRLRTIGDETPPLFAAPRAIVGERDFAIARRLDDVLEAQAAEQLECEVIAGA